MTSSFTHDSPELARTYDRASDSQFESGKRLVERLGPASRILDVGCGTGRLVEWIVQHDGDVTAAGVDPLPDRIEIARSRCPAARFEVGQAEDLGAFADASFDAVCMSAVLHWVADKPKALAEARRVLRPGGRVGVTTIPHELGGAGTIAHVLLPLLQRAPYAGKVDLTAITFARHGTTVTDLVKLVMGAGLELVELHVMQRNRHHASGADLVDFLEASSFGNFLRIVSEDLRPALRADLAAAFDANKGPDGVASRDWGVLFVAARV